MDVSPLIPEKNWSLLPTFGFWEIILSLIPFMPKGNAVIETFSAYADQFWAV
jgi:hypothetical protein